MRGILIILIISILSSFCGNKTKNSQVRSNIIDERKNSVFLANDSLDALLKCDKFSYMDGYFTIPDHGCIYFPQGNNSIGNAEIYLIPKIKLDKTKINVTEEENKINSLTIDELKSNYKIYIFLIDKEYLKYYEKADVVYYPEIPYKQYIFQFNKNWEKIATLNITTQDDSQYNKWKKKLLQNISSESNWRTCSVGKVYKGVCALVLNIGTDTLTHKALRHICASWVDERLQYIHENPVRNGLVANAWEYLYSSASDYQQNKKGLVNINFAF